MLEMNLKAEITNINYLRYMEYSESENGAKNQNLDGESTTQYAEAENEK